MEPLVKLQVELGINAQRIMQQVHLNHQNIEELIKQGIELALKDITEEDNFIQAIRNNVKNQITLIANKAVMSYEMNIKLSKAIDEAVGVKLKEYADKIASQITKSLE